MARNGDSSPSSVSTPSFRSSVPLDALQVESLGVCTIPLPQCNGWEAAHCIADLENADFVSIRFDCAAVSRPDPSAQVSWETLEEYFRACIPGLDKDLPTRIGICCCHWNEESAEWELSAHEVGLWPGDLLTISEDIQSNRFRTAEMSPQAETNSALSKKWASQLASSTRWVVTALLDARVPVVVHHGLPDLLQLCDKLVGQIPASSTELAVQLSELFPIVFDTGAFQDGLETPDGRDRDCQGLDELYNFLSEPHKNEAPLNIKEFGLYTHRSSSIRNGLVFGRGLGASARDAMCIAEVFLRRMNVEVGLFTSKLCAGGKRHRDEEALNRELEREPGTPKRTSKRQRLGEDAVPVSPCKVPQEKSKALRDDTVKDAMPISPHKSQTEKLQTRATLSPSLLQSHAACRRFHNRLAFPSLKSQRCSLGNVVDPRKNLRSLLHELGAGVDSNGRPIVTRKMLKKIKHALVSAKNASSARDGAKKLGIEHCV